MPEEPSTVEALTTEYLSFIASKIMNDPSVEVVGFNVGADPFEFPRFGEKQFFEIKFEYRSTKGAGHSAVILRVLPGMDAVMMITGDTQHRELKAFETGLYARIPKTFHIPYVHVIDRPDRGQYWAFVEDVRPEMQALGMHTALPDETLRTILTHLAAFHAEFWQKNEILSYPWLMSLRRPVDYFYRCVTDILDGMKDPADASTYIVERWPWLSEGVINLMQSLPPETSAAIEGLYREPERLVQKVDALPTTLCHYDFDNRNLGMRRGPEGAQTVVIDWEILGVGLSSSDVGRFLFYQQLLDAGELTSHYLDELERYLGRGVDREEWLYGSELVNIAEWQIRGVLFGVMVSAPSAPVPEDQRDAMAQRARSDIAYVESLVRRHGLA